MRNVRLTFGDPIMNCLDRPTSLAMDGCCPTESSENLVNDGLHVDLSIPIGDILQAPSYPESCVSGQIPSWHTFPMQDATFDRDLVRKAMKEQRVTQKALADLLGLSAQSAVAKILAGDRKVSYEEGQTIYEFLGLLNTPDFRLVPVIGFTSAGNWREAVEDARGQMPIPNGIAGKQAFGLEVAGDSMNLLIEDGGWVLIDPAQKVPEIGGCYLVHNGQNEVTVKRYREGPQRFEPVSSNPDHKPFLVEATDFSVLGKVVWKGAPV